MPTSAARSSCSAGAMSCCGGGNMQRSTSEQRSAMLTPALNVPVDVFNWDPRGVPGAGYRPLPDRFQQPEVRGRLRRYRQADRAGSRLMGGPTSSTTPRPASMPTSAARSSCSAGAMSCCWRQHAAQHVRAAAQRHADAGAERAGGRLQLGSARRPEPGTGPYVSSGQTVLKQQGGMGRFSLADPLTLVLGGRMSGWNQQARRRQPHRSRVHAPWRPDPDLTGMVARQLRAGVPAAERAHARRQVARSCHGHQLRSRRRASWPTARSTCRWPSSRSSRRTAHSRIRTGPAWATTAHRRRRSAAAASRPRSGRITPAWTPSAGYTYNTSNT